MGDGGWEEDGDGEEDGEGGGLRWGSRGSLFGLAKVDGLGLRGCEKEEDYARDQGLRWS